MANANAPYGFVPYNGLKEVRPFMSEAYVATRIFVHDLVARANDGYIDPAATQSVYIVGSALDCLTSDDDAIKPILVACDPLQKFMAQADSSGDSYVASITVVGNMVDHTNTTGDTTTMLSKQVLDTADLAAGAGTFLIEGIDTRRNPDWGAYADLYGILYEHYLGKGGTAYI